MNFKINIVCIRFHLKSNSEGLVFFNDLSGLVSLEFIGNCECGIGSYNGFHSRDPVAELLIERVHLAGDLRV